MRAYPFFFSSKAMEIRNKQKEEQLYTQNAHQA